MKWSPALQFAAFTILVAAGLVLLVTHIVSWKELGIGTGGLATGGLFFDRFLGLGKGDGS